MKIAALIITICLLIITNLNSAEVNREETHHDHAIEFDIPLFMEKPVPCSELRFDYIFSKNDNIKRHTGIAFAGLPLTSNFGFEAAVPYSITFKNDEKEYSFDDLHFSVKAAHFPFNSFAFGYGAGISIPAEREDDSEHGGHYHVEPFYAVGYLSHYFQAGLTISVEIPVKEEHAENEGSYGFYALFPVSKYIRLIGECEGRILMNGEDSGKSSYDFAFGIRIYPSGNERMNVGLGIKIPLYNCDFDFETLVSLVYHI